MPAPACSICLLRAFHQLAPAALLTSADCLSPPSPVASLPAGLAAERGGCDARGAEPRVQVHHSHLRRPPPHQVSLGVGAAHCSRLRCRQAGRQEQCCRERYHAGTEPATSRLPLCLRQVDLREQCAEHGGGVTPVLYAGGAAWAREGVAQGGRTPARGGDGGGMTQQGAPAAAILNSWFVSERPPCPPPSLPLR